MRNFSGILRIFLALILTAAALTACDGSSGGASGDETFKVGAVYPMSGSNALQGRQCMAAVRIAVEFVNRDGGVRGRRVELFEADAPDPSAASTETERLTDQKGARVIFGSLASGNALAAAAVCERNGALLIESGGIADALTDQGFQNVFRILDKGALRGGAGVEYIADELASRLGTTPGALRLAVIREDSSYGESVAAGARDKAEALGMNIVFDAAYNVSVRDMSAIALGIKDVKPDVLITVNYVDDAILIFDALKQYGAVPKVIMGLGAGTTSPKFARDIGSDSDGVFCTDMPTNLAPEAFGDPAVRETVLAFRKAYTEANPEESVPPIAAEAAFAGAYTFLHDILPYARSLETDDMREAARSTELPLTTLGFGWRMGEDGQNYAARANINQWQAGEIKTVFPAAMRNGDVINVPLPNADIR